MNKAQFDLNLLLVFDALMEDRSVTRASERIGLSQSAMSHALGRLRILLKDELFIRTPSGMEPTLRAEGLAPPLRQALSDIKMALHPVEFDPTVTERTFAIAVNNAAAIAIAPALARAVQTAAPAMRLDLRPSGTLNVFDAMDRGELDLAIGGFNPPAERFASAPLLEDRFVLTVRRGHPSAKGAMSAKTFAALPHLEISSSHEDTSFIDDWLDKQGFRRRVVLRAPYLSAASLVSQSDMVVSLTRSIAKAFVKDQALQICEPPYVSPRVHMTMLWHRRVEGQPAHRWLRELILRTTKET